MIRFDVKEGLNLPKRRGYPDNPIILKTRGTDSMGNAKYIGIIRPSEYGERAPVLYIYSIISRDNLDQRLEQLSHPKDRENFIKNHYKQIDGEYVSGTPGQWYISTLMGRDGFSGRKGRTYSNSISIHGDNWVMYNYRAMMDEIEELENSGQLPIKPITEGLNLPKKAKQPFELLVAKWKPTYRRVTTLGYEWEFPIEAYHDLIYNGYDWAVKERVTNKEHPEYGQQYVSIDMSHGRDSGLEHLVKEGLNLAFTQKFKPGDRVQLNPSAPQLSLLPNLGKDVIFIIVTINQDGRYTIIPEDENYGFYIEALPQHLKLIDVSPYQTAQISEHWKQIQKISEGLNIPKKKWKYYSLIDLQNDGQLMWTGLNSESLDDLKTALLSYLEPDYQTEPYDGWENDEAAGEDEDEDEGYGRWLQLQGWTVFELADFREFSVIRHTQPFDAAGDSIDSDGGEQEIIYDQLNEGLNLVKRKLPDPERWIEEFMSELKPYRSHGFPNTIFYRKDERVYMQYHVPTKGLMYHLQTFTVQLEKMGLEYDQVAPLMKRVFEAVFNLPVKISRNDTIATSVWWKGIQDWYPDRGTLAEGLNLLKKQLSPPQSWFQSILNKTTGPYTTPDYPNSLFYTLDGEVIFEYDQETWDFWVDYDTIWSVFMNRFGMKYNETLELIESMLEEHYKLGSVTPNWPLGERWFSKWKNITNWDQNIVNEGLNLPKMIPQSWFKSILNQTTGPHTIPKYPDLLFYKLVGEVIFEYDQITGYFYVDYDEIWSVFENRFGMEYDEILELIKSMVEEYYNLESVTPTCDYGYKFLGVEEQYKLESNLVNEGINLPKKVFTTIFVRGQFESVWNMSDEGTPQVSTEYTTDEQFYEFAQQRLMDSLKQIAIDYRATIKITKIIDCTLADVDNAFIRGEFEMAIPLQLINFNNVQLKLLEVFKQIQIDHNIQISKYILIPPPSTSSSNID